MDGEEAVTKRWTQRPPGSTWGDWGDDDELGRVNLLTPEKVLAGIREVEHGVTFCLSLPLDYGTAADLARVDLRILLEAANAASAPRWNTDDFFAEKFGGSR